MEKRKIRLMDEARQDLHAGKSFYDSLQQGVGDWFRDSLIADIESLHIHAGVHEVHFGFYRMLAKRFPYAVYYSLDSEYITVVAVLPMRRSTEWLTKQFPER